MDEIWTHPGVRGWIGAALLMVILWVVEEWRTDAGIVDVGWAAATGGLGVYYALVEGGTPARRYAVGIATGIWGARLALYLLVDRVIRPGEDRRYQALRALWSRGTSAKFFLFFQAQALLAALLSGPFLMACRSSAPVGPTDALALVLFLCGVAGESTADRQLARFKAGQHQGRTCREGLWRYSRHPNYFFEWIIWCGFGLASLAAPGLPWGLLSPAVILFLILKVTGIPPTELQALKSRGDDYREYQRTTSAFIPWFVKR